MNTKYEFVPGDEITIALGRTVKRIRSLVAISDVVSPGALGGYIEHEGSLDTSGNAWVSGNARVSGNAQVFGNAQVCGNAWVSGNARVYGNARVCGDALVYGNARVCGDAQVYGNARVCGDAHVYGTALVCGDAQVYCNALVCGNALVYGDGLIFWASKVGTDNGTLTVYTTKDNNLEVTRGCFRGTVDEFLAASECKHDDNTHLEYRMLIEVAYSRITRAMSKA